MKILLKVVTFFAASTFLLGIGLEHSAIPFLFIHPLLFLIFNLSVIYNYLHLKKYFVFWVIYLQAFIRFLVIPFTIFVGGGVKFYPDPNNYSFAIWLMSIELIILTVFFNTIKKDPLQQRLSVTNRITTKVLYLFIISFCIIIFLDKEFFNKINFIWSFTNYFKEVLEGEDDSSSSFANFFFPIVRTIGATLLILSLHSTRIKTIQKFVLSLLIVVFNASIIVGSSRFSIFYTSVPLILLLSHLYPMFNSKLRNVSLLGGLFVVIVSSISKYSTHQDVEASFFFSTEQLNAYFSGVYNYCIGIDSYFYKNVNFGDRFYYLMSDVFKNVPVLSKISLEQFQTSVHFNNEIYGLYRNQDQIVPVTISGAYHFSLIFPYFHYILFLWLAFYWERRAYRETDGVVFITYLVLAFGCSILMMVNIGSIYKNIFTYFIFLLPLLKTIKLLTNAHLNSK